MRLPDLINDAVMHLVHLAGNLSPKEMEPLMLELKAFAASRGFTIEASCLLQRLLGF